MRFAALALLLPLLTPSAHAAGAEPQDVVLHFVPQPGDKLRQNMDMKMQMAMNMLPGPKTTDADREKMAETMKKMPKGMTMDMKLAMRTEASEVDAKGDYLLHIRGDGAEMVLHMPDAPPKSMPNPVGGLEVDALTNAKAGGIEILRVKSDMPALKDPKMLDSLAHGLLKQAFGSMQQLEGRRMKIGESAEIPFDLQMPIQQLPQNAHVKADIVFTLKSVQHGIAHFDTAMKMSVEVAQGSDAAKSFKLDASGSGAGVMDYRIADHLPMRQDMDIAMRMDMQMPGDVSMQMDMKMQMHGRGERYR
jgi:hypothetical protein